MAKSFLYRWFGLRKVPAVLRSRFETECILFDEEGTSCALAYKNFRGTHKRSGRGWESVMVGTLVITGRTFYVHLPYMILCDQPIEEAIQYIELELKSPNKLVMKFEVEKLFANSTGNLTCYWRTENASRIFNHLSDLRARNKN